MTNYTAQNLEVLTGLDPVRRRAGMYTDTSRPNHLAQEVIDNSVDEALAGFAKTITVILHADNSLSVEDDGRGMPTDIHPQYNQSGIEIILTKLHAGVNSPPTIIKCQAVCTVWVSAWLMRCRTVWRLPCGGQAMNFLWNLWTVSLPRHYRSNRLYTKKAWYKSAILGQ